MNMLRGCIGDNDDTGRNRQTTRASRPFSLVSSMKLLLYYLDSGQTLNSLLRVIQLAKFWSTEPFTAQPLFLNTKFDLLLLLPETRTNEYCNNNDYYCC